MKPLNKKLSAVYEVIDSVVVAAVVVILIFTFVFRIFVVAGDSMKNTLFDRERIIVSDFLYKPTAGDIICFWCDIDSQVLVKRVIATEGQVVDIDDLGRVTVDGTVLDEPYVTAMYTPTYNVSFPHVVEDDCVFVLGDNRVNSKDSRFAVIGDVPENRVFGKLVLRLYPNFGKVN